MRRTPCQASGTVTRRPGARSLARSLAQSSAAACRLQRQPKPAVEMVRPLAEAVERLAEIVALLVEEHH